MIGEALRDFSREDPDCLTKIDLVLDRHRADAKEQLPKIFEAFYTTRSAIGTGIGLFVAKQFIEGHGGRIEVKSSTGAKKHGTEMTLILPLETTYERELDA